MSKEPESQAPPKRISSGSRRRTLFIIGISLLVVFLFAVTAGIYFVRTGRLNRYIVGQVQSAVQEYGLRADIGSVDIGWGAETATVHDVKLYNMKTNQLIASVKTTILAVEVTDLFALRLKRNVILKQLNLDGLELYYSDDGKGHTSLDGFHTPPPTAPSQITFDYSKLIGAIKNGTIHYDDQQHSFKALLQNLEAGASPAPGGLAVLANLKATGGTITFQDRTTPFQDFEISAQADDNGAQLKSFVFRSDPAELTASGQLNDYHNPKYNFDVKARGDLAELGRIFAPDTRGVSGEAAFTGQITGLLTQFQVTGNLTSDDLSAAGARLRGLRADQIVVKSEQNKIIFSSKELRAQGATVSPVRVANLSVQGVRGEIEADGRIQASTPRVFIARADLTQGNVSDINLTGVQLKVNGSRYELRGDLGIKGATLAGAQLGATKGRLTADNNSVALNKFTAGVLGGSASGDLTARLAGHGEVHVVTSFKDLATGELVKVIARNTKTGDTANSAPPLAGTIAGQADLSFPLNNPSNLTGSLNAQFAGQTTQTGDAIPVNGQVAVKATNGAFNIDQLQLATAATTLTASGKLSPAGDSDLAFSVTSTHADELVTIANSLDLVPSVGVGKPALAGDLKVTGTVAGKLDSPTVTADVNAASVGLTDAMLGSLTMHLIYSPTEVRIQNGLLTQPTGGQLSISLATPITGNATTGTLDATFTKLDLGAVLTAAGLPSNQTMIVGGLNGEAHLTNLPGAPAGTVTANLTNGTIAGQPVNSAQAKLNFNGETATLETIDLQLPQGRLLANGTYGFNTKDFQLSGRAENVALDKLVASISPTAPAVTGVANATFSASGNTEHIEQSKVQLDATGQNVSLAGQTAGELQVTARTAADGRVNLTVVTGVTGKPQTLTAMVDLRRPNYPIEVSTDLKNFELGPALAIFAPGVASVISGTVSGTLRVTGPLTNKDDEFSLEGLTGGLTLTAISLNTGPTPITIATPLVVKLSGTAIVLETTRITAPGTELTLGGTLGLTGNAELNFTLTGTADLAPLTASLDNISANGKVSIDSHLAGTVAAPKLSGTVTLRDGSIASSDLPVDIVNVAGHVTLTGDRIVLDSLTANANDGTVTSNGEITLAELFKPTGWTFKLKASDVDLYYAGASVIINSDLSLAGSPQGQTLSGTITIPDGEYLSNFDLSGLVNNGGGGTGFDLGLMGPSGTSFKLFGQPIGLDVNIQAQDTLLVRNSMVNTAATALLHIGGSIGNTDLSGQISLDGGKIKFRNQQYDITAGTLTLTSGAGAIPLLNLTAESTISGYTVQVGIRGPLNKPDLILQSEPQLARADILTLITTGRLNTGTLNSDQLLQTGVTTAASLLSSQLLFDPLGQQAQQLFGLSQFQIDPILRPNTNPAARITLGRQLARNFSFTYSTNLGSEQDQVISFEYDISSRFSAIAAYSQGGLQSTQGNSDSIAAFDLRGRRSFSLGTELSGGGPTNGSVAPRPSRPHADVEINGADNIKLRKTTARNLLPIETEGFSRALMRLGVSNLTNYFQEQGYFFATVTPRCEPVSCIGTNLKVFYDVRPGRRYDLEKVNFEAPNFVDTGELKSRLETKQASTLGGVPLLSSLPLIGGLARGITSDDRLRRDRETIQQQLADQGYRSAHVVSRLGVAPDKDELIVTFTVDPGPISTISDVKLEGPNALKTEDVQAQISVAATQPFSLTAARQAAQEINTYYAQSGYLDVTTNLNVEDLPNNGVRLTYSIIEGNQAIVHDIAVKGQTITHEDSIRRFFTFNPGDILTPDKIRQTQRNLYATGAFREVNVTSEKIDTQGSARHVIVQVTESKPLTLTYGIGYSSDEGPRGLIELTDSNLFGRANGATLRLRGSHREELAQLVFTDPRPYGVDLPLTFSVFYDRNTNVRAFAPRQDTGGGVVQTPNNLAFGVDRFAAFVASRRKLEEHTWLRLRYSFENVRLFNVANIPILEIAPGEQSVRLGTITTGFTHDVRDSAIDPEKGYLYSVDYTLAARSLGGSVAYNKVFGNFQDYLSVPDKFAVIGGSIFAMSARIGLASPFGATPATSGTTLAGGIDPSNLLPISERFFAGGVTTLRGFRFDEAGPQAVLEPQAPGQSPTLVSIGGDAEVILNYELRIPVKQRFQVVPFYDFGNVFLRPRDIRLAGMSNTVGLGLRVRTPVGPIGIDVGHLLNPQTFFSAQGIPLRQPTFVFHIRFGESF